jgi:hypothetical protein
MNNRNQELEVGFLNVLSLTSRLGVLIGISTLLLLVACEGQVELDTHDPQPELVLNSNFAPNQPVVVQVSKTRSPLSTEDSLYLDHATVELYEGNRRLELLELVRGTQDAPPYYTTRLTTPAVGNSYTLRATAPDFATVSATSRIPVSTRIRALELYNLSVVPVQPLQMNYTYEVAVFFDDPGREKNYYHLNFYQQVLTYRVVAGDTLIVGEQFERVRFTSQLDDNSLIAYFEGGVLFDDKKINGIPISYSFPLQTSIDPRRQLVGKMFAELRTVSEEYYLYYNSLSRQRTGNNGPFADPVMIYGNVENGQGIFAGYNASVDSVAIQF